MTTFAVAAILSLAGNCIVAFVWYWLGVDAGLRKAADERERQAAEALWITDFQMAQRNIDG